MGRLFGPFNNKATLPVFDIEMSRGDMREALDYVSERLRRKEKHLNLIVTGEAFSCLHLNTTNHCSNISIIPASPLSEKEMTHLATSAKKAAKKFNLGADWINNRGQAKAEKQGYLSDVVQESLKQKEVIYSSEALVLYAVDYTYALKSKLHEMSVVGRDSPLPSISAIEDTVTILHKLVTKKNRGRPVKKGYLSTHYPNLEMSDSTLLRVGATYEWKYRKRGISGVNDEWLEWRREGRLDLDFELEDWGLGGSSSHPGIGLGLGLGLGLSSGSAARLQFAEGDDKSSIEASSEDGIIPIIIDSNEVADEGGGERRGKGKEKSPYAIDYGFREAHSESSTRACSPAPKSLTPKIGLQGFLRTWQ